MKNNICGYCDNHYCGYCNNHNRESDVLDKSCKDFIYLTEEYKTKGVVL